MTPSERAEAVIREKLAGMASGQALPPVRELAAEIGDSNATIQKAFRRLRQEGLIGSRPGWAVYKI